jgi:DNA-directed RNA polymerase subunit beta'
VITNQETGDSKTYLIPYGSRIKVLDGDVLEAGDELTEGSVNPHDILKIKGVSAVQDYMLREVQRVYRLQGVEISDKHIEVLVRQMLKKVRVEENGDTDLLPGTLIDALELEAINEQAVEEGKEPASGKQILLGITKASLATNSFLSAASFQETTKVLTDAAIHGRTDPLIGLKENVIIGKLIPAGTGMKRYRSTRLSTDARIRAQAALAAKREEELNAEEIASMMAAHSAGEEVQPDSADVTEPAVETAAGQENAFFDQMEEDAAADLNDIPEPDAEDLVEMEEEMEAEAEEAAEEAAESEEEVEIIEEV